VSVRPVIGITSYAQPARWGAWDLPAALIPLMYVEAVERAGGRPVVIPPSENGAGETLDLLDGVVFSGGADVDPASYGAEPHPLTDPPQARRDRGELALLEAALARDVPMLAICRGSQLLNVLRGGDLVQHLPDALGHTDHRETPGIFSDHEVTVDDETRLGAVLGGSATVKSSHHQGLGRLGEGLVEAARATDGTVEALEDPSKRFAVGVLWHPEAGEDQRLFDALVEEARRYRASRPGAEGRASGSAVHPPQWPA
jgi:gamma-glutamyl-gamma-aminobutyrate hydrolase PuuD